MSYYYLEPEIAGGLGECTVMDRSVRPPVVKRLHYELDGRLVVSQRVIEALRGCGISHALVEPFEESGILSPQAPGKTTAVPM